MPTNALLQTILRVSLGLFLLLATACSPASKPANEAEGYQVIAVESFLADITRQVAGDRLKVESLIPAGIDPHVWQPKPRDLARLAECDLLVVNGAGLETWLEGILKSGGQEFILVEASANIPARELGGEAQHATEAGGHDHEVDPHFWLDPLLVIDYVENIRQGMSQLDPAGAQEYSQNAAAYTQKLRDLDAEIRREVETIPVNQRILITNHESLGYFADRYGFTIAGTVIPSLSTNASPSAREMAELVETIRSTGAKAIFVESGANPDLARQFAAETGIQVVTGLYNHSLTDASGPAPDYLSMMRENTRMIVDALR